MQRKTIQKSLKIFVILKMALTYNGLWRYNPGNIVKAKQFYRFLYCCMYVLVETVLYQQLKIAISWNFTLVM